METEPTSVVALQGAWDGHEETEEKNERGRVSARDDGHKNAAWMADIRRVRRSSGVRNQTDSRLLLASLSEGEKARRGPVVSGSWVHMGTNSNLSCKFLD